LKDLRNLGQKIIRKLGEIGIYSEGDLRRVGISEAYLLMQKNEEKRLPVCYYLYSLEGALEDKHWDEISDKKKTDLLKLVGKT